VASSRSVLHFVVFIRHRRDVENFSDFGVPEVIMSDNGSFISDSWFPDAVEAVCSEPDSYVVKLADWRVFRRTRRVINLDNLPSTGLPIGQQSGGAAEISSAVPGYRPASTNYLLPSLSWSPPGPPARAVNGQVSQSFPVALGRPSMMMQLPSVVVNPSSGPAAPARPRAAPVSAGQRAAVQLSPAQSPLTASIPLAVAPHRPGLTLSGCPYLKPC
jgi:hypothetical protein